MEMERAANACSMCDGKEFECLDGFYFCIHCQTQSQDYREEEFDYEQVNWGGRFNQSTGRKHHNRARVDFGRSWRTIEVFQIILKEQVKALIKLGADKSLDNIVWRLWTRYLSRSKIAFSSENCESAQETDYPRIRDIVTLSSDMPLFPGRRACRSIKKKIKEKHSNSILKVNVPGLPQLEREKDADDDDEFRFSDEDENVEEEELDDTYATYQNIRPDTLELITRTKRDETKFVEVKTLSGTRKIGAVRNHRNEIRDNIKRMNMVKTLAFCKLGLLYTNNLVMLADIIRWSRQQLLPYLNVANILPEDIVLQGYEFNSFFSQEEVPPIDQLSRNVGQLVDYLDIDEVPAVEFSKLIGKYGVEMALPGEIIGMAQNFLLILVPEENYGPHKTAYRARGINYYPLYEAQAMAYIIITLKLLFGINDHSEREISKYGQQIRKLLTDDTKNRLFIWDEWATFMEKRIRKHQSQMCPNSIESLKSGKDIKACMRQYQNISSAHVTKLSYRARQNSCPTRYRPSVKDSLVDTFKSLLDVIDNNSSRDQSSDESPLFDKIVPMSSDTGEDLHFGSMSVQYLIDDNFFEKLDEQDAREIIWEEADIDTKSSEVESDDSDTDQLEQVSSTLRMADVFGKSRKRKLVLDILLPKNSIKKRKSSNLSAEHLKIVNDLQKLFHCGQEIYPVYGADSSHKEWHLSYNWLLDVCSYITETPKSKLQLEVSKLEYVYILDRNQFPIKNKSYRTKVSQTFH